jgi:DNA-binding transcriptional ArsR family regulator
MVNYLTSAEGEGWVLDATFAALADPTRRAILARLALGEATVGELAAPFEVSLPAISKHLRVLESAGLLRREIDGRVHRCRLAPDPMKDAAGWIESYRAFWESQFDGLVKYLEATGQSANENRPANEEKPKWQPHQAAAAHAPQKTSRSKSGGRSVRRGKKSSPPSPNASS